MLNPARDLVPPPSSPTISSISSSDLDTESTGSFFHDRSTTLGTLMGVTFPSITFRPPSRREIHSAPPAGASRTASAAAAAEERRMRHRRRRRRRRWWRLCRDDAAAGTASLGEFLEVERRSGDGAGAGIAFYEAAAELEGAVDAVPAQGNGNGRLLFAEGRVLPPPPRVGEEPPTSHSHGPLSRFPVLLTGICCNGGG